MKYLIEYIEIVIIILLIIISGIIILQYYTKNDYKKYEYELNDNLDSIIKINKYNIKYE